MQCSVVGGGGHVGWRSGKDGMWWPDHRVCSYLSNVVLLFLKSSPQLTFWPQKKQQITISCVFCMWGVYFFITKLFYTLMLHCSLSQTLLMQFISTHTLMSMRWNAVFIDTGMCGWCSSLTWFWLGLTQMLRNFYRCHGNRCPSQYWNALLFLCLFAFF